MSLVDVVEAIRGLGLRGLRVLATSVLVVCTGPGACVELYNPSLSLDWDSEGRLSSITVSGVDSEGRQRRFKRTLGYDSEGRLTSVSPWVEVGV